MNSPDEPDPIKMLSDALRAAGLAPTFDRRRSTALPCWRCDTTSVPRELVEVGRYTCSVGGNMHAGDAIERPLCAACIGDVATAARRTMPADAAARRGSPATDDQGHGGPAVTCGFHDQPLDTCPCPKGPGAWLEYRRLWKEQRDRVAALLDVNALIGEPSLGLARVWVPVDARGATMPPAMIQEVVRGALFGITPDGGWPSCFITLRDIEAALLRLRVRIEEERHAAVDPANGSRRWALALAALALRWAFENHPEPEVK